MTSPRDDLLPLYRQMLLIRRIEEQAARAYVQGKIGGFLHLYIGQEAIAVGAEAAIRESDYVITTYRDHGFALARGIPAREVMAELYGRDTGCARGLGGSMHMFSKERRFLGGHAIVGGHLALSAGVAFRARYLEEDDVTLCFFGEGATNIGGWHEGLSLAALWDLPIVFVCENNEYSMGTPLLRTMPVDDLTLKAPGYGIAKDRFEGHDVREVRDRLRLAVQRAREERMPTLVEILTYRFRGHSMSDPGRYRTNEEVEERKRRHDPVRLTRAALLDEGVDEGEVVAVETSVAEEVEDAARFAEESPPATREAMDAFVLAPDEEGA
ncbi:MAG: pyruvate dehydrogenase (acetyl-transferring) E1 component subunit alpha [Sandaracinaceae bacterium]